MTLKQKAFENTVGKEEKRALTDLGSITYQCNRLQLQLLPSFMITDYIMITQIFSVIDYNYNYFCIVIMITCDYILIFTLI